MGDLSELHVISCIENKFPKEKKLNNNLPYTRSRKLEGGAGLMHFQQLPESRNITETIFESLGVPCFQTKSITHTQKKINTKHLSFL